MRVCSANAHPRDTTGQPFNSRRKSRRIHLPRFEPPPVPTIIATRSSSGYGTLVGRSGKARLKGHFRGQAPSLCTTRRERLTRLGLFGFADYSFEDLERWNARQDSDHGKSGSNKSSAFLGRLSFRKRPALCPQPTLHAYYDSLRQRRAFKNAEKLGEQGFWCPLRVKLSQMGLKVRKPRGFDPRERTSLRLHLTLTGRASISPFKSSGTSTNWTLVASMITLLPSLNASIDLRGVVPVLGE